MNIDILAFGAHPDDVELGCGGSLAKEIQKGKTVAIIDLTKGELGTRGNKEMRTKEATEAARILNVSLREQLDFADGFFVNDKAHQLEIIKIIRKYKPTIVICNAVSDRHIDHNKGAKLVSDACFLSGLIKINTGQEAHRPKLVYHYIQWNDIKPDFVVDITSTIDIKLNAIMSYKSQFYNPQSKEPETPISSHNFYESISYRAKDLGRLIGVNYAEGFTVERYVGANFLSDLV